MRKYMFMVAVATMLFVGCRDKDKDAVAQEAQVVQEAQEVVPAAEEDTVTTATQDTVSTAEEDNSLKCEPTGRIKAVYQSTSYREMKRTEIPNTGKLTGLFHEDSAYYLRQEKIAFEEGYSECAEVPTLSLVSEARFLFLDFKDYNKNKIQAIPISLGDENNRAGKNMPPGEKFAFDFGDKQYELEAFGKPNEVHSYIANYSLVYSIKGAADKQMIVN